MARQGTTLGNQVLIFRRSLPLRSPEIRAKSEACASMPLDAASSSSLP